MSSDNSSSIASDFEWVPDYDALLQQIASTDVVDSEWSKLRDIIKYKIEKNIALFLTDGSLNQSPPTPRPFSPITLESGGLKLPPFPPRKTSPNGTAVAAPVNYMGNAQVDEMKEYIFAQLHTFDTNPPFTVQRLCELVVNPQQHYNCIGKYLRAVEKSMLVTSTWDAFPIPSSDETEPTLRTILSSGTPSLNAPATPLFSPIPFLHEDARRSKSRSPPPSPLVLPTAELTAGGTSETPEIKSLGLVDELDDPSPGHMSDHPTALSAVTTVGTSSGARPLFPALEDRFVKSETAQGESSKAT
ncbi:PPP4R2 family protein [Pleurotus pulmonarius]